MRKVPPSFSLLNLIFLCVALCRGSSASLLSARCKSRCFAKQEVRANITSPVVCTTSDCLACLKPCEDKKTGVLSCATLCSLHFTQEGEKVCRESCKFVKHTHLGGVNSSCPTGVPSSKCVLMKPENVQVSVPERNKKAQSNNYYTISWNGTWPTGTVFVVLAKQQRGSSLEDSWTEIKQTTAQSVKVDLQPLVYHQFKVAAVSEYGASSFSLPSRFIFASARRPGPPRDFKVTSMHVIKGHVEMDVSWKKPDNAIGLPIHRYKLSWSLRLDEHSDKMISLLEVTDRRIKGNIHQYQIKELLPNRTYVLEIQAISRWRQKRLRSQWVILRIRTPAVEEGDDWKKPKLPIKKVRIKGNALFKKKKEHSEVLTKPTALTTKQTSYTTDRTSTASTANIIIQSSNLEAQKSVADVIRISWVVFSTAVITTVCCL